MLSAPSITSTAGRLLIALKSNAARSNACFRANQASPANSQAKTLCEAHYYYDTTTWPSSAGGLRGRLAWLPPWRQRVVEGARQQRHESVLHLIFRSRGVPKQYVHHALASAGRAVSFHRVAAGRTWTQARLLQHGQLLQAHLTASQALMLNQRALAHALGACKAASYSQPLEALSVFRVLKRPGCPTTSPAAHP